MLVLLKLDFRQHVKLFTNKILRFEVLLLIQTELQDQSRIHYTPSTLVYHCKNSLLLFIFYYLCATHAFFSAKWHLEKNRSAPEGSFYRQ